MVNKYFIVIFMAVCLFFVKDTYGNQKLCRFMNPVVGVRLESRDLWNPLTGFFCYFYTYNNRLNFMYNFTQVEVNGTKIFASPINNGTDYFWYDYLNETSLEYISASFSKNVYFEKWKTCSREAADCCDYLMDEENIHSNDEYPCPAVWDSWSCFSPAKASTTSKLLCPEITFSSQVRTCELTSEKECFPNGTWINKTNYDTCAIAPVLRNRHKFNIIVLAVATALTLPAVIIFFSYRNLRQKLMFILHRNLILAIIIRNLLTIVAKEIIIMGELRTTDGSTIMANNGVPCRVLAFFENVAKNLIFACMLADGFYLHQSIARPFVEEPSMVFIYVTISVLSILPSLTWAILRGVHQGTDCWMVDSSADQWACDGFRVAILVINTFLLIDIIRVMILKLRRGGVSQQTKYLLNLEITTTPSKTEIFRTTVRVTLFLVPLFGLHIIVISNRNIVPDKTCDAQDVYYYISYLMEGLQGIMVALLFCYINSEVHRELLGTLRRVVIYLEQKFETNLRRQSVYKRRPTTATYVGSESEN